MRATFFRTRSKTMMGFGADCAGIKSGIKNITMVFIISEQQAI